MRNLSNALLFKVLTVMGIWFCFSSQTTASERIALLIGNSNYQHVRKLKNPTNDIDVIFNSLLEAKFQTSMQKDLSFKIFRKELQNFVTQNSQKNNGKTKIEAVLFYYAGHGVQFDGQNFLLPIDVKVSKKSIRNFGIDLNLLIAEINKIDAKSYIIILDACRNNPINESDVAGLAEIDAGPNNYIMFSARPGAVAEDGQDSNSPFASAVSYEMQKQGLPIEVMSRNVRKQVFDDSSGQQLPWDSSSLLTQFEFIPLSPFGNREEIEEPSKKEEQLWGYAVKSNYSEGLLRQYLLVFPNGRHSENAKKILEKK